MAIDSYKVQASNSRSKDSLYTLRATNQPTAGTSGSNVITIKSCHTSDKYDVSVLWPKPFQNFIDVISI